MSIRYLPGELLKKIAPERKIKKLLSKGDLSLKRTALSFVEDIDFIDPDSIEETALKVIDGYKARVAAEEATTAELVSDPAQLIQRVQNQIIFQVSDQIRGRYDGEFYKWLPSGADEADPEHQLLYGEIFPMGEGDSDGNIPGERYGCQCGMEILVDASSLDL